MAESTGSSTVVVMGYQMEKHLADSMVVAKEAKRAGRMGYWLVVLRVEEMAEMKVGMKGGEMVHCWADWTGNQPVVAMVDPMVGLMENY